MPNPRPASEKWRPQGSEKRGTFNVDTDGNFIKIQWLSNDFKECITIEGNIYDLRLALDGVGRRDG